jgi:hypothetical protein
MPFAKLQSERLSLTMKHQVARLHPHNSIK